MFSLHGTGIGGGIVIARARVHEAHGLDTVRYRVQVDRLDEEVARLDAALGTVRHAIRAVAEQLPDDAPPEASALLDVHAMILDDPSFTGEARRAILAHGWNAEWALSSQASQLVAQFEAFEDEYLRERRRDIEQVANRVLRALAGTLPAPGSGQPPLARDGTPTIVIASDIAPADILVLKHAAGFGIDLGGITAHTTILARSMNVPAVVGLHCATELVRDDDWLILDGEAGLVIVAPDETVLSEYRRRQAASQREREKLRSLIRVPARTRDAVDIALYANIELPEEAEQAYETGAAGVGLFRSEFLFMNRRELPDEDEQFEAYRAAVRAMRGLPVTIRTLDIGADKAIYSEEPAIAPNPALGQRAIRLCLAEQDMFLGQLRAILRASAYGPTRLLIPMLAHVSEITQTVRLIGKAKLQLAERGERFDPHLPVGGMIEIPAAALSAPLFARRLDFLSIGTNDLVQYTLAIDRADHAVAALYDPFHPAVLRLIAMTIEAGRHAGKPVAVCGEIAGDWLAARLLLGMGLREFSMHSASLLRVKQEILSSDTGQLAARVRRLLASDDPRRVQAVLARLRRESARREAPAGQVVLGEDALYESAPRG